jgi:hypothetical protein
MQTVRIPKKYTDALRTYREDVSQNLSNINNTAAVALDE